MGSAVTLGQGRIDPSRKKETHPVTIQESLPLLRLFPSPVTNPLLTSQVLVQIVHLQAFSKVISTAADPCTLGKTQKCANSLFPYKK